MPLLKNPCVACKEKHLKCSDDTPKCKRCQTRKIDCIRAGRRKAFKNGSSANYESKFSSSQNWVKSSAREFRLQTEARGPVQRIAPEQKEATPTPPPETPQTPRPETAGDNTGTGGVISWSPIQAPPNTSPYGNASAHTSSSLNVLVSPPPRNDTLHAGYDTQALHTGDELFNTSVPTVSPQKHWDGFHQSPSTNISEHDNITIQEACLLKHFIDKLSHWFDTCDPRRSFELLVPERARHYPPLLNAIYAVSARHLCRKFQTARGVIFQGQLLSTLTPSTAVEYMLKCIPVLREFHTVPDEETRELIVTMAVILRQFEEMDDDVDENDLVDRSKGRVNFLSVINAVLKTSRFEGFFRDSELLKASYWVAMRQEIYYALSKGHAPEMVESPQGWDVVSPANRLIVHTSKVAGWLFNGKSVEGYVALKEQEAILSREVGSRLEPILSIPANKEKGDVFPRVWFRSSIALTSMQHFMTSKMILVAESPLLGQEADMRTAFRNIEGEVRSTILDICGSALEHLQTPPALVNAALAISLYGHFFVDEYERRALQGIISRFQDAQAWPVPRTLEGF